MATHPLNTTEILEMILLHLPLQDLLHTQKICRLFRDVVHGSLPIQQALFFKPVAGVTYEQSELAIRHRDAIREGILPQDPQVPVGVPDKMPVNPFLRHHLFHEHSSHPSAGVTLRSRPRDGAPALDHANETASWRRMLVFQPHASPLSITRDHRPGVERKLENGLTMDEMFEMRREDDKRLISEYPRALPYPLWFKLQGVEWDRSSYASKRDEENVHHETRSGERQISGWEILTTMRAIAGV